ncbi:hypothetical protein M501DRAFT_83918 [Patellaria atrata CBS 101060]|uniref:DUF7820 domain-containing protein n=1 Tax=Patellaria atrata CBS 101060 TaxID=1346257 RepID=A0A9P4VX35_9PEZI|nr:hypothetical protein M501DRAFT_83918 [Patellaria atrata CBS 101060]
MARRQFEDNRNSLQSNNQNVFDDEFADDSSDLDLNIGVADGFRPGPFAGQAANPSNFTTEDHAFVRRSISGVSSTDQARKSTNISRNSTTKHNEVGPSPTPRNDHSGSPVPGRILRTNSSGVIAQTSSLLHRSSVASTSSYATTAMIRSQSPFQGQNGPSHPYGMYPQGTGLGRSESTTTASTLRTPQSSYSVQQSRPTHPYAMYTQNVVGHEEDDLISQAPPAIPVGFPGLSQTYHRQIGPDGEEQDIIGPDGHTEQLPPYSRFPEEGPTKASMAALEGTPTESPPVSNQSQDTIVQMPDASPTESFRGLVIPPSTSTGDSVASEKRWNEKTWKEKRKTKFLWGKVPLWVILSGLIVIMIFATILGAVVGSFVTKEKMEKKTRPATVTVWSTASLIDASAIPTPTNMPNLPTGKFSLPLPVPEAVKHGCLVEPEMIPAWSCEYSGPKIQIEVDEEPQADIITVTLSGFDTGVVPDPDKLNYGHQSPMITPQNLILVADLDEQNRGPAYHFQTLYDKLVILKSDEMYSRRKRNSPFGGFLWGHRNQLVAGEEPWFCWWNHTLIEGYIYVTQNSTFAESYSSLYITSTTSGASQATRTASDAGRVTSPPPVNADTNPSRTEGIELATPNSNQTPDNNQTPDSNQSPDNNQVTDPVAEATSPPDIITTETLPLPTPNSNDESDDGNDDENGNAAVPSGARGNRPSWAGSDRPSWVAAGGKNAKRFPPRPRYFENLPPPYPRIVKIEERRLPSNKIAPYCQKMVILEDGRIEPKRDVDEEEIIIEIEESNPSFSELANPSGESRNFRFKRSGLEVREDPSSACHCQWVSS